MTIHTDAPDAILGGPLNPQETAKDTTAHRRPIRQLLLAMPLFLGLVWAASAPAFSAAPVHQVVITAKNIKYSPTTITLKKGQKVTFSVKNMDKIKHNLNIKGLKVNTDVPGTKTGIATLTPNVAGTYEFHCEYHPQQMKGTITVS